MWKAGFIGNPLIRFASAVDKAEYSAVVNSSFILNVVVSLLQIILLLLFSNYLSQIWEAEVLSELFIIFMISAVFLIFQSHYTYLQQANLNFKGGFWSNLARQSVLFGFLFITFLIEYSYSLVELAYAQALGVLVSMLVAISHGKKYHTLTTVFNKDWILKLINYGKYTFATNISSTILRNVDSWMLGSLMSVRAVGLYNPALRLANLFELPTSTLTSIAFPKLVQRIKEEGEQAAKYLYEKSMGLMLAVLLPLVVFVVILAEPIILLLAGEEYLESVAVLRVTMLYGLIVPFNRQVGITLDALGKPKLTFLFVLRNTVINVVLNYIFITNLGLIGAALATFTTFVFALVYNQIYIRRALGVSVLKILQFMTEFYVLSFKRIRSFF